VRPRLARHVGRIDNAAIHHSSVGETFVSQRRLDAEGIERIVLTALMGLVCTTVRAVEEGPQPKRARPPKWTSDVLDVFFVDAREKLAGQRPNYGAHIETAPNANQTLPADRDPSASGAKWSHLIGSETLETEIKRLAQAVARDVTTPSDFKGGKYQDCRRHFSTLAMLFAVAAEYDVDVRWQDAAAGLRELFARAGFNCKVGTDQTYREAIQRMADLAELVAGSRPRLQPANRVADWSQVADRPPLMQRMNIAHEERLTKWLANEQQFAARRDEARHEAQLIAVVAEVIRREGFDYWDDEQYAAYANELRQAASDVAAAADSDSYEQAREAGARITRACTSCHEGYRG
jgi:hypothetical protein